MQTIVRKDSLKRLKTIRGHINYIIKAVEEERHCIEVLQQSSAVQSALRSFDGVILKGHLEEHASVAMKEKGKAQEKAIQEIVDIFKKGRA